MTSSGHLPSPFRSSPRREPEHAGQCGLPPWPPPAGQDRVPHGALPHSPGLSRRHRHRSPSPPEEIADDDRENAPEHVTQCKGRTSFSPGQILLALDTNDQTAQAAPNMLAYCPTASELIRPGPRSTSRRGKPVHKRRYGNGEKRKSTMSRRHASSSTLGHDLIQSVGSMKRRRRTFEVLMDPILWCDRSHSRLCRRFLKRGRQSSSSKSSC